VNGIRWCYDPNGLCAVGCNVVCASLGLPLTIDDVTWFNAQNTVEKCLAIAHAFGAPPTAVIAVDSYSTACIEDQWTSHRVIPGGLSLGVFYCSTDPGCPARHRLVGEGSIYCDTAFGGDKDVCPCQ
jgi:hypothetical protein